MKDNFLIFFDNQLKFQPRSENMMKGLTYIIITFVFQFGFSSYSIEEKVFKAPSVPAYGAVAQVPRDLGSYNDSELTDVKSIIENRIQKEPFNLIASIIFLLAILHTFVAPKFTALAHKIEHKHRENLAKKDKSMRPEYFGDVKEEVSFLAEVSHFLGEVEAIFGLWVIVLSAAFIYFFDWSTMVHYIADHVNFTEPMFVVVIMTLAATRPILKLAESFLGVFAKIGGGKHFGWWFTIMTLGPLMGSFITEPGAMTISALLLAKQFYGSRPSKIFGYATIGLLFVNISIGGVLTHFAAPPVLMVAGKWGWGMTHMLTNFGWKAVIAILISNTLYVIVFRNEFKKLDPIVVPQSNSEPVHWEDRSEPVPFLITLIHIFFMFWTVFNAHHPVLFIGGFLFFLGFAQATIHHQNRINLKPALMVGFFLAGLVIHGGLQAWWLAPVLGSLTELPLMIGATILTAFNDNAAITYLSSLVPDFSDTMKYAVMAGAVTGGGLTVIANAPNPAGQSILGRFFENGVSPLWLASGALIPTVIVGFIFMLL